MGKRTVHTGDGHWSPEGETPDPKNQYGFIYLVVNEVTKGYYIGKKTYLKPLSPKMRSRKFIVRDLDSPHYREQDWSYSDWRTYTGSSGSASWQARITSDPDSFKYLILDHARSAKELSMKERWYMGLLSEMMTDPLCENILLPKAYKVPPALRACLTSSSTDALATAKRLITDGDRTTYPWEHKDTGVLPLTCIELLRKFPNLDHDSVAAVAAKTSASHKGWSLNSKAPRRRARKKRTATHRRTTLTMTVQQWADRLGLSYSRTSYILTHGSAKYKITPDN